MFRRVHSLATVVVVLVLFGSSRGPLTEVFAQRAGAEITGSVVDVMLAPIAGVVVTLERAGRVEATTKTDADGVFHFTNVAPGSYQVRAERAGLPAFTRDLRVPAGVTAIKLPIVMANAGDNLPPANTADARGAAGGVSGSAGSKAATGGTREAAPPVAAPIAPPPIGGRAGRGGAPVPQARIAPERPVPGYPRPYPRPGESYTHLDPNRFQFVRDEPLSTFGADVDTASYSNIRRFLSRGQLPPRDAVRVEELVNYFRFAYDEPRDNRPLRLTTEIGDCPWAPSHKLVLIGARARSPLVREIAGRNIVLLVDVSGSMAPPERLPLIQAALGLFVDTLRRDDRLAIVTYAGTSGVALPSTPVRERAVIQRAIAGLSAGGSTNGGQGLVMAYRVAREAFVPGGVNRVILATDGDFNVGIVRQDDLLHLIERERDSGVFLSVFGVGSGNLKDSTMEMLADHGNGHYAYIDSLQEARRVLVREGEATLETVAKDVKFQVEFNPTLVNAWKLVGYEDRLLAPEDFNDDRKDGGEMGAGHTVTVLYEIAPVGVPVSDESLAPPAVDPLKYQRPQRGITTVPDEAEAARRGDAHEWLTVKARYKSPEGDRSDVIVQPLVAGGRIQHLPLASAVAEFGLLLRSGSRDSARWGSLAARVDRLQVPASLGADRDGFKELVAIAQGLVRLR